MAALLGWTLALLAAVCVSSSRGAAFPWRGQQLSRQRAARDYGRCLPDPQATDIGDRASCPFDVVLNVDPQRIPVEIPMASCRCPKYGCGQDQTCVTLSYMLEVTYNVSGVLKPKKIEASSGCVCAMPQLVAIRQSSLPESSRNLKADYGPGYYLVQ
ncbi:uncharacterized protein LOC144160079 [Haemaphysalis longicornis]